MYEFNPYMNAFELFGAGTANTAYTLYGENKVVMTRALDVHFCFDLQTVATTSLSNAARNSIYRVPMFAIPQDTVYAECPYSRNGEYGTCIMRIQPDGRVLPVNGVCANGVAPIFYFSKMSYSLAGDYFG